MRHFIVNDEAQVTKPKLVADHGFYVYEVDVSARLISVEDDVRITPTGLVELDEEDLGDGAIQMRSLALSPTAAKLPTLAERAAARGTTIEGLVEKYTRRLDMGTAPVDFTRQTLLDFLKELEA